ncbi:hypothetical protein HAX54_012971, partial [Datura stramonium]|nr:hypothetical protein [Datura stramonium]
VMANNPKLEGNSYKPSGNDKPLEYLRLTSLVVLGSLTKFSSGLYFTLLLSVINFEYDSLRHYHHYV